MSNNKKSILSAIAVILLVLGGWYLLSQRAVSKNPGSGEVVAKVNGEDIYRNDLETAKTQIEADQGVTATSTEAESQVEQLAMDSLIARVLLVQATQSAGITASSTAVDAQIETTKGQFESPEAYAQALSKEGITEDDLRQEVGENMAIQTYLDQELNLGSIGVTDEEIQTAYDQVAASQTDVPALTEVQDQVKKLILQEKQQKLVDDLIKKLRSEAQVEILI